MRSVWTLCVCVCSAYASSDKLIEAQALYQDTQYEASLRVINASELSDVAACQLAGKNHYMLNELPKAIQAFEKALNIDPHCSDCELWLGRTYGKRAETGAIFAAPLNASKARQHFEKAVELNPQNAGAMNDLFQYYLNAPEFLGGGVEKAEAIAKRIANERPPESHFELAAIAEKKKDYADAEAHFRQAIELAPGEVGRILDLARFLARRGRIADSDECFAEADRLAPNDRAVIFARAQTYIEQHRNPEQTRKLLQQYLEMKLSPDDPPKAEAEKLLRQVQTG